MPLLSKLLSKFDKEERKIIEFLLERIISLNWRNLDIKKLRGYDDIFRARKGKIRIIFAKEKKEIYIIAVEHRNEKTYKL